MPLFNIRVLDGLSNVGKDKESGNYLDASVELPMYTLAIEQAIALCSVTDNVPHVKFTLEWDAPAKSQIIADDRNPIEEHSSVKQVAKCPSEATAVSLKECFGLYTKAEKLGDGDAWFCPECKRKQEVVKRMGLWSLPDVLIIHLKRFRQTSNTSSNKLSTMVECPLEGYDMSPFVTNNSKAPSNSTLPNGSEIPQPQVETHQTTTSNMWTNVLSSFKKDNNKNSSNGSGTNNNTGNGNASEPMDQQPQKEAPGHEQAPATETAESANFAYDLYAVCNHHGDDLQGGHYTATCRNPTDGHWYSFDDNHTSKVDESDVVSADAYILFYQKQSLTPNSSSTSSASSSSSSNQEHWVYRMPDFSYKNKTQLTKAQTQSTVSTASTQPTSGTTTVTSGTTTATSVSASVKPGNGNGFNRNSPKYATLPAAKSESSDISAKDTKKEPLLEDTIEDNAGDKVDQSDAETKSLPECCKEMQEQLQKELNPRADSVSSNHNNHEDVSRPIDKNDVD